MEKLSNHVISRGKKWAVTKFGADRASKLFKEKQEAVEYGERMSRKEKTVLYIHKRDGRVEHMNAYGNDPFALRDKKG